MIKVNKNYKKFYEIISIFVKIIRGFFNLKFIFLSEINAGYI